MLQLLYPLLLLQGFCLWHAYRSGAEQKWYWMILFIPYVGCFLYLYDAYYTRRTVETAGEGIKQAVNSNYAIEKLENEVTFSSSVKNKLSLADAYSENGRYKDAITVYEECREGFMADDEPLARKLLEVLFLDKQYDRCIAIGNTLSTSKSFRYSDQRISLAWALHYQGRSDQSYQHFSDMDKEFSNYDQRYAFCKFLVATGKQDEARRKADVLMVEFDQMKSNERNITRRVIDGIRNLVREIDSMKNAGRSTGFES